MKCYLLFYFQEPIENVLGGIYAAMGRVADYYLQCKLCVSLITEPKTFNKL